LKIYKIIIARKKPFTGNQPGLLNTVVVTDVEQQNSTVKEETDKERELKLEISRLYRQIEEMRSLSMRIANPHLIPKKTRFGYQTKKTKINKSRNVTSDHEISRIYSSYEPEGQSLVMNDSPSQVGPPERSNTIQLSKTRAK
jgi:hypothetical protein